MRDQINQALAPLQERFDALDARERMLVIGCGVFLLLAFVYAAVWKPLAGSHASLERQLSDARAIAQQLVSAESAVQKLRRGGSASTVQGSGRSVMAVVDQTGRSASLDGELSVQPDGSGKARARIDNATFDATLRWINQMESRYGLAVESASISGKSTPGRVEARITMQRPQ